MVKTDGTITGKVSLTSNSISGSLTPSGTISSTLTIHSGDMPVYQGDYQVDPLVNNEVVLRTRSKIMSDDVTIRVVPRYITSNVAGGNTIFIGEE